MQVIIISSNDDNDHFRNGWFDELPATKNCFVIPTENNGIDEHQQDERDADQLYDVLEKEIIPIYYDYPQRCLSIIKKSMTDIVPAFDSNRLAREYYEKLYN